MVIANFQDSILGIEHQDTMLDIDQPDTEGT